jgi:hypothetical protein
MIGGKLPSIEYGNRVFRNAVADTVTGTLTGVDFGSTATGRVVVVAMYALAFPHTSGISSVTIGGVGATRRANANHAVSAQGNGVTEIWAASGVSGTSGNVVVTTNGTQLGQVIISSYSLYDLLSAVPHDTGAENTVADGGTIDVNLDVPSNGIVLAAFSGWLQSGVAPGVGNCTMTGVTEVDDAQGGFILYRVATGTYTAGPAEAPRTVNATGLQYSSSSRKSGCAASWR